MADELEVIVVSDGPDAETAALFHGSAPLALPPVTYLEIPKSQQGVARNAGVKRATAPFVLFIGDDILLEQNACERHLAAHRSQTYSSPTAVLGFTTWDPVVEITPVMRWLEKSGWQFGYLQIRKYSHTFLPKKIQERFTYTSNISVPTDEARKFKFREDMTLYGWEDIEWGMRMKQAGIRLYYEPDATALHHHHMRLEDSLIRAEELGRSLTKLAQVNSDFRRKLAGWRLVIRRFRMMLPTMEGKHHRALLHGIQSATKNS